MANDKSEKHETQFPLVPAAPQAAQPADLAPAPKPDAGWTIAALLACAMGFLSEAGILARKTTLAVLRAGLPLWLIRERLKPESKWCQFQREHNLPRTSVWEAIEFHLRVTAQGLTEEQVGEMAWSEAKEFFGIAKPRKNEVDDDEGPVDAELVEPYEDSTCTCTDLAVARDHIEHHGDGEAVPAVPATKANKIAKKDHAEPSPCEIDAATTYVKAVGGWDRADYVLQSVKNSMGV